MLSIKTPFGRVAIWVIRLQVLNMKIAYAAGQTNVIADSLSTPTCEEATQLSHKICSKASIF